MVLSNFSAIAELPEVVEASVIRPSVSRVLLDVHGIAFISCNAAHKRTEQTTQYESVFVEVCHANAGCSVFQAAL